MDCTQWREALSARLDGEDGAAERGAVDVHLASCAACCRLAEDAAMVSSSSPGSSSHLSSRCHAWINPRRIQCGAALVLPGMPGI
ncbi:MAG: zf-HC2 domain-containing protein [Pseudonocardiaceae bacterium]